MDVSKKRGTVFMFDPNKHVSSGIFKEAVILRAGELSATDVERAEAHSRRYPDCVMSVAIMFEVSPIDGRPIEVHFHRDRRWHTYRSNTVDGAYVYMHHDTPLEVHTLFDCGLAKWVSEDQVTQVEDLLTAIEPAEVCHSWLMVKDGVVSHYHPAGGQSDE